MVNVYNIFAWFLIPGIFFYSHGYIFIRHNLYSTWICNHFFIKMFDIWTVLINILYLSSAKKDIKYDCLQQVLIGCYIYSWNSIICNNYCQNLIWYICISMTLHDLDANFNF